MAEKSGRDLARQRVPRPGLVEQMKALIEKHEAELTDAVKTVVFRLDGSKVKMAVTFVLVESQHY